MSISRIHGLLTSLAVIEAALRQTSLAGGEEREKYPLWDDRAGAKGELRRLYEEIEPGELTEEDERQVREALGIDAAAAIRARRLEAVALWQASQGQKQPPKGAPRRRRKDDLEM